MSDTEKSVVEDGESAKRVLKDLHNVCTNTFNDSFSDGRSVQMASAASFISDLSLWAEVVPAKPEIRLFTDASNEMTISLLNLAQGQYRNSFKGLRLTVELVMQGIYLSANLIELEEWMKNERHTNWAGLQDDENGPLGIRFCKAFFPDLMIHRKNMLTMSATLYTELSETIHGNIPNRIPLPDTLQFDIDAFSLWHEKAKTGQLIIHFALAMRYLQKLDVTTRDKLADMLNEQLGHIAAIRVFLGGPETQ